MSLYSLASRSQRRLIATFEIGRGGGLNVGPMEGLRGFAVLLVFLVHYVTLTHLWIQDSPRLQALTEAIWANGNNGVDLFFVLSGYLIYRSLMARHVGFLRFMSRRVQRIYPTFVAVLALYLALSVLVPSESKIPGGFVAGGWYLVENLLLLPGLFPIAPIITVAWSLSYEMAYYLALPCIVSLCALRQSVPRHRVAGFLGMGAAIVAVSIALDGPVRLVMFVAGVLLHEALQSGRRAPSSALACSALVVSFIATPLLVNQSETAYALRTVILAGAFGLLSWVCFARPHDWLARVFAWTPLRWLGNMSYSYYLLHGLALKATVRALALILPAHSGGPWLFWGALPFIFAVTLVASTALFAVIERPFSLHVSYPAPRRAMRGVVAPPPPPPLALPPSQSSNVTAVGASS